MPKLMLLHPQTPSPMMASPKLLAANEHTKKPSAGKKPQQDNTPDLAIRNSFEILAQTSEEKIPFSKPSSALPSSSSQPPPSAYPSEHQTPKVTLANPKDGREEHAEKDNEMEVDGTSDPLQSLDISTEGNSQVQQMDEEPKSIDLNGLDILELEAACKKKAYESIPELQLNKLKVVISRAYHQQQLGIQPGSQWDGGLPPKDSKKRGRRTDL